MILLIALLILPVQILASNIDKSKEIIDEVNLHLTSIKLSPPQRSETDIYRRLDLALNAKDQTKLTSTLEEISREQNTICSAYSSDNILPRLTGFLDAGKTFNDEYVKSKSWSKGLQSGRLWLKLSTCESSFIYNALTMAILEDSLKKLSLLDKRSLSQEEKKQLQLLKSDIRDFSPEYRFKVMAQYELISMVLLIISDINRASSPFAGLDTFDITHGHLSSLFMLMWPDFKNTFQWKKAVEPLAAVIDAVETNKFKEKNWEKFIQNRSKNYLTKFITATQLSNEGISSFEDLKDEKKISALLSKLKNNKNLLEEKQKLAASFENQTEMFIGLILHYSAQSYYEIFEKFKTRKIKLLAVINKI